MDFKGVSNEELIDELIRRTENSSNRNAFIFASLTKINKRTKNIDTEMSGCLEDVDFLFEALKAEYDSKFQEELEDYEEED